MPEPSAKTGRLDLALGLGFVPFMAEPSRTVPSRPGLPGTPSRPTVRVSIGHPAGRFPTGRPENRISRVKIERQIHPHLVADVRVIS